MLQFAGVHRTIGTAGAQWAQESIRSENCCRKDFKPVPTGRARARAQSKPQNNNLLGTKGLGHLYSLAYHFARSAQAAHLSRWRWFISCLPPTQLIFRRSRNCVEWTWKIAAPRGSAGSYWGPSRRSRLSAQSKSPGHSSATFCIWTASVVSFSLFVTRTLAFCCCVSAAPISSHSVAFSGLYDFCISLMPILNKVPVVIYY